MLAKERDRQTDRRERERGGGVEREQKLERKIERRQW